MPGTEQALREPLLATGPEQWKRRNHRVLVLLLGIVVLSIADLVATLFFLRTVGMVEANPIAAFIIRFTQSSWVLALYKLATVGICVTLLYRVRHSVLGECASWLALLILAGLTLLWHQYSTTFGSIEEIQLVQAAHEEAWLYLD